MINRNEVALISGVENVSIERPELLGTGHGKIRTKAITQDQKETTSGFRLTPFYFEILTGEILVAKGTCSVATNIQYGKGNEYIEDCVKKKK